MPTLAEQLYDLATLLEATVERDASFRRKANALATKIEKFLRSRGVGRKLHYNSGVSWTQNRECLECSVADIDPKYRDLNLLLFRKSARPNAAGSMRPVVQGPGHKWFQLRLYILPDGVALSDYVEHDEDDPEGADEWALKVVPPRIKLPVPSYVQNLIVHELIHYFDFHRGGEGFSKSVRSGALSNAGKLTAYFNTPEEFNAYYQAGANKVVSETRKLVGKLKRGDKKAQGFSMVFIDYSSFLDWVATGDFWHAPWIEALSTEYRRKFKARLFQLFEALRKQVEQAYSRGFKENFDQVMGYMGAFERRKYGQVDIHHEWPVPGLGARRSKYTRVPVPDRRLFIPGKKGT